MRPFAKPFRKKSEYEKQSLAWGKSYDAKRRREKGQLPRPVPLLVALAVFATVFFRTRYMGWDDIWPELFFSGIITYLAYCVLDTISTTGIRSTASNVSSAYRNFSRFEKFIWTGAVPTFFFRAFFDWPSLWFDMNFGGYWVSDLAFAAFTSYVWPIYWAYKLLF